MLSAALFKVRPDESEASFGPLHLWNTCRVPIFHNSLSLIRQDVSWVAQPTRRRAFLRLHFQIQRYQEGFTRRHTCRDKPELLSSRVQWSWECGNSRGFEIQMRVGRVILYYTIYYDKVVIIFFSVSNQVLDFTLNSPPQHIMEDIYVHNVLFFCWSNLTRVILDNTYSDTQPWNICLSTWVLIILMLLFII